MDAILIDCAGNTALGGASQRFAQTRIVLGRDANCDLRFDAERELQVSSEHAAIERDADGLLLIDLGAANGVYYQGERIDGQVRIEAGAEIRLGPGGPKLTARIGGTGAPATMVVEAPAILQASTTSPAVTPRAERKVGIGAATMRTALNTATKHERKRFLVLLTLVALPLLAIAGWAAYAAHSSSSDAARVGERLTAAEQENVSLLTG
ncbi:MAG: FHA domain-containing protein, partial [Planctomycetota bacterium]|nr:FHA domain-containing protein [Planctomycetota bacterium]